MKKRSAANTFNCKYIRLQIRSLLETPCYFTFSDGGRFRLRNALWLGHFPYWFFIKQLLFFISDAVGDLQILDFNVGICYNYYKMKMLPQFYSMRLEIRLKWILVSFLYGGTSLYWSRWLNVNIRSITKLKNCEGNVYLNENPNTHNRQFFYDNLCNTRQVS